MAVGHPPSPQRGVCREPTSSLLAKGDISDRARTVLLPNQIIKTVLKMCIIRLVIPQIEKNRQ